MLLYGWSGVECRGVTEFRERSVLYLEVIHFSCSVGWNEKLQDGPLWLAFASQCLVLNRGGWPRKEKVVLIGLGHVVCEVCGVWECECVWERKREGVGDEEVMQDWERDWGRIKEGGVRLVHWIKKDSGRETLWPGSGAERASRFVWHREGGMKKGKSPLSLHFLFFQLLRPTFSLEYINILSFFSLSADITPPGSAFRPLSSPFSPSIFGPDN